MPAEINLSILYICEVRMVYYMTIARSDILKAVHIKTLQMAAFQEISN
ncbi:hypothetical protein F7734_09210 [Scytonema sp. UIC 10036]|nr:hypothetical protein [Scytonema sp. UIC 10036]